MTGTIALSAALAQLGVLQHMPFELSADQIKHLSSSPVEVLPPPGPNSFYLVSSIIMKLQFVTTQYTTNDDTASKLALATSGAAAVAGITGGGIIAILNFGNLIVQSTSDQLVLSSNLTDTGGSPPAQYLNCGLYAADASDLTVGDSTLKFDISYRIVDLS